MTDTPTFDALRRKADTSPFDAAGRDPLVRQADTPTYDALAPHLDADERGTVTRPDVRGAADPTAMDLVHQGRHRRARPSSAEVPQASQAEAIEVVREVASVLGVSPAALGSSTW
jgi:hypothetical protein